MAWHFRRSLKLGPLRLNFSKSGIGYSAGVRGFRVGQDARGRTYTAASIPGTGLYNRQYSGVSKPIAQSAANPTSTSPPSGTGNGLKLFIAFMLGGVVFSIIGAMISSSPVAAPTPPPAAVIAPVAPPPATPVKRRAHGSKRASAPGHAHPSVRKASPPAPDAVPPAS
ncbi:MAG: DUF4236 domain-containing protein [Acidobacteriota bacterium]|nr:DUF4236 domain-containing protein [Acidobacteriota bacterium]